MTELEQNWGLVHHRGILMSVGRRGISGNSDSEAAHAVVKAAEHLDPVCKGKRETGAAKLDTDWDGSGR